MQPTPTQSPLPLPASPGFLNQPTQLSTGDIIGLIVLVLSLAVNAFQLYQQRVYGRTIYNGLVGTFNSIGWLLARCMNKTAELREKLAHNANDPCLSHFLDYSLETEWHLRGLHEQLVAVAKTLRSKDARWQAGQFGLTNEEIQRIRDRFEQQTRAGGARPGGPG